MKSEKEIKAMITLLDDPDDEIREQVENHLVLLGETVIPHLEEANDGKLDPEFHLKIEVLKHRINFNTVKDKMKSWNQSGCKDLLEGMWLICKYEHPELDIQVLRDKIAEIYCAVFLELNENLTALEQIKVLNFIFFNVFKFTGNTTQFYKPENYLLNKVMDEKKGNPISLCIIYMLVAKTLKLPVYGVNLPNLFVLTYKKDDLQFYINVFNKGVVFTRKEIEEYLQQLNVPSKPEYFEPCDYSIIIERVIKNLIIAYEKKGEEDKMKDMEELLKCVRR